MLCEMLESLFYSVHVDKYILCNKSGFSLTPSLESFIPTFGLGTPVFPRISSNLHCGTPTFSKRCLWDSYFQNPSGNPDKCTCRQVHIVQFLLFPF